MANTAFRLNVGGEVKLPKFLRPYKENKTLSDRPRLPIDELEGDGDARNTAKGRPSQKTRTYKQVSRRLAEAEEWIDFIQKKKEKQMDS